MGLIHQMEQIRQPLVIKRNGLKDGYAQFQTGVLRLADGMLFVGQDIASPRFAGSEHGESFQFLVEQVVIVQSAVFVRASGQQADAQGSLHGCT